MVRCAGKGPIFRTDCGRGLAFTPAPACCARTHSTTRTVPAAHLPALTALCNECTMQSLHSAITHPAPPAPRQLSNFPTSRKADKLASWQVGKHRHLPLHHQPVPAAPLFSLPPPVNQPLLPLHLALARAAPAALPASAPPAAGDPTPPYRGQDVPPTAPCIPAALAPTAPPEPCR